MLGPTLSRFMGDLGLVPTGGRWGSIPRLQAQLRKLFACRVYCTFDDRRSSLTAALEVASEYQLWWDPKDPDQATLWQSSVTLGEAFFKQIIDHPVPIDKAALRALKRSPLALDLYVWMTHRFSYLDRATVIPWAALGAQVGADYAERRFFKRKAAAALARVLTVYPEARFEVSERGLLLRPSPTHVGTLPAARRS